MPIRPGLGGRRESGKGPATGKGKTMGVAFHELKFLTLVARQRPLGEVLTFARQDLNVSADEFAREYGADFVADDAHYADGLLRQKFGATSVSSVDNSDYEGATYVANLNEAVDLGRQFDTIVDCGGAHEGRSAVKDAVRRRIKGSAVAGGATLLYRGLFAPTGLTRANPHLTKVSIASQLR